MIPSRCQKRFLKTDTLLKFAPPNAYFTTMSHQLEFVLGGVGPPDRLEFALGVLAGAGITSVRSSPGPVGPADCCAPSTTDGAAVLLPFASPSLSSSSVPLLRVLDPLDVAGGDTSTSGLHVLPPPPRGCAGMMVTGRSFSSVFFAAWRSRKRSPCSAAKAPRRPLISHLL